MINRDDVDEVLQMVKIELKTLDVIAPYCSNNLIIEAGDYTVLMPSFEVKMHTLDISTICIFAVWMWMIVLGYQYNKKHYYIDGHTGKSVQISWGNLSFMNTIY